MTSRSLASPMLLAGAVFTAGGGYVHLHAWLDGYRYVPAATPGSWLVRVGFPVAAGISVLLAAVLLAAVPGSRSRLVAVAVAAGAAFNAGALALVVATRSTTVFGWTEPIWDNAASQSRAVEVGALLVLGAAWALRHAPGGLVRDTSPDPLTAN